MGELSWAAVSFNESERRGLVMFTVTLQHMVKLVSIEVDPHERALLRQIEQGLVNLIEMIDKRMQVDEITVVLETSGGIAL